MGRSGFSIGPTLKFDSQYQTYLHSIPCGLADNRLNISFSKQSGRISRIFIKYVELVLVCFCPAFFVEFQYLQLSFGECTFVRQSARQLMQRKFQYLTKTYTAFIIGLLQAMLTVGYVIKSKFQTKVLRFERIFIQYVEFFLVWLVRPASLMSICM